MTQNTVKTRLWFRVRRTFVIPFLFTAIAACSYHEASALSDAEGHASEIQCLIGQLKGASKDWMIGYAIATELAEYREEALPFLLEALTVQDCATRTYAARAMTNMMRWYGESLDQQPVSTQAISLIQALENEQNFRVYDEMLMALAAIQPDPEIAIPILLQKLEHPDNNIKQRTVVAIGSYGVRATQAKPALIKTLEVTDRWVQSSTFDSLKQIGLVRDDLAAIMRLPISSDSVAARKIFGELMSYPELALIFLKTHNELLSSLPTDYEPLIELFSKRDPARDNLRTYLLQQDNLPEFLRVNRGKNQDYGFVMTFPRVSGRLIEFTHNNNVYYGIGCSFPQEKVVTVTNNKAAIDSNPNPEYPVWFDEELARIRLGDKWGYIDRTGTIVISPRFDEAGNFSHGVAVVEMDGKCGYIRRDISYFKKPQYNSAQGFRDGLGPVEINGKWGLISIDRHSSVGSAGAGARRGQPVAFARQTDSLADQ